MKKAIRKTVKKPKITKDSKGKRVPLYRFICSGCRVAVEKRRALLAYFFGTRV